MQHLEDILDLSRQAKRGPLSPWFDAQLHRQVEAGYFPGPEELQALEEYLLAWLADYRTQAGVETAVLGMSGGVDSALTAALLKRAGWRVVGYTLPIEQVPAETERGIEACQSLGLEHLNIDLSEQYRQMVAALAGLDGDISASDDPAVRTRRGNIRARLRMITLYDQAHRWGGLVASTDNFSELGAGFWTLHGDVGDLAPLQALLKSWEVPFLARALDVPERTWRAMPTDGLGIGEGDEAQIGVTYLEWDIIIAALLDALRQNPDVTAPDLIETVGAAADERAALAVDTALKRLRKTWFKRINPITLEHATQDRFAEIDRIDGRLFRPEVLRKPQAAASFSAGIAAQGQRLAHALAARRIRFVTAESCTAGLLAGCVAATPQSSEVLEGSYVTYRKGMKIDALDVPAR